MTVLLIALANVLHAYLEGGGSFAEQGEPGGPRRLVGLVTGGAGSSSAAEHQGADE